MFGRTILRKARLIAPPAARSYVAPLAARQLRPASVRLYSTAEPAKPEETPKTEQSAKAAEQSAKAAEQPGTPQVSEELEKALKELEEKKLEAKDYKVSSRPRPRTPRAHTCGWAG
jgi:hypothetical protein